MRGREKPTLAVVGATGAVGTVMLEILSHREYVWGDIKLLASARSAGKVLQCRGQDLVVEELTETSFDDVDVAMFVRYFACLRTNAATRETPSRIAAGDAA